MRLFHVLGNFAIPVLTWYVQVASVTRFPCLAKIEEIKHQPLALFPGLPTVHVFAYCKQTKTGD